MLLILVFPSFIAAGTIHTYITSVPFMSISYGAGTILMPGTSIKTEQCDIKKITLDNTGTFTISCEVE
jgi:hypothetical protein